MSDDIAVMYLGQIVEHGPAEEVFEKPLHPYTKALFSAIPISDPEYTRKRERFRIPGEPSSPINPPSGCRFHPRCPFKKPECSKEEPPTVEYEKDHFVKCWLYARK